MPFQHGVNATQICKGSYGSYFAISETDDVSTKYIREQVDDRQKNKGRIILLHAVWF